MNDKKFKFELGEPVQMKHSEETGEIIARAEFVTSENQYFVRYLAGNNCQIDSWWGESALVAF